MLASSSVGSSNGLLIRVSVVRAHPGQHNTLRQVLSVIKLTVRGRVDED